MRRHLGPAPNVPRLPARSRSITRALRGRGKDIVKQDNQVQTYTVEDGDTLWDIAQRNDCSVTSILKLNGLAPNKSDIFPGQVLKVPFKPAPAPPVAAPAPPAPSAASKLVSQFSTRPEPVLSLPTTDTAPRPAILSDPSAPIFTQFPYSVITAIGSLLILASIPFLWIGKDRVLAAVNAAQAAVQSQLASLPTLRTRLSAVAAFCSGQWAALLAAVAAVSAKFCAHVAQLQERTVVVGDQLSTWLVRFTFPPIPPPSQSVAATSPVPEDPPRAGVHHASSGSGASRATTVDEETSTATAENMTCIVISEGISLCVSETPSSRNAPAQDPPSPRMPTVSGSGDGGVYTYNFGMTADDTLQSYTDLDGPSSGPSSTSTSPQQTTPASTQYDSTSHSGDASGSRGRQSSAAETSSSPFTRSNGDEHDTSGGRWEGGSSPPPRGPDSDPSASSSSENPEPPQPSTPAAPGSPRGGTILASALLEPAEGTSTSHPPPASVQKSTGDSQADQRLDLVLRRLQVLVVEQSRRAQDVIGIESSADGPAVAEDDATLHLARLEAQLQSLRRGLAAAHSSLRSERTILEAERALHPDPSPAEDPQPPTTSGTYGTHALEQAPTDTLQIRLPEDFVPESPEAVLTRTESPGVPVDLRESLPQGRREEELALPPPAAATEVFESPEAAEVAPRDPLPSTDLAETMPLGRELEELAMPNPSNTREVVESPESVLGPAELEPSIAFELEEPFELEVDADPIHLSATRGTSLNAEPASTSLPSAPDRSDANTESQQKHPRGVAEEGSGDMAEEAMAMTVPVPVPPAPLIEPASGDEDEEEILALGSYVEDVEINIEIEDAALRSAIMDYSGAPRDRTRLDDSTPSTTVSSRSVQEKEEAEARPTQHAPTPMDEDLPIDVPSTNVVRRGVPDLEGPDSLAPAAASLPPVDLREDGVFLERLVEAEMAPLTAVQVPYIPDLRFEVPDGPVAPATSAVDLREEYALGREAEASVAPLVPQQVPYLPAPELEVPETPLGLTSSKPVDFREDAAPGRQAEISSTPLTPVQVIPFTPLIDGSEAALAGAPAPLLLPSADASYFPEGLLAVDASQPLPDPLYSISPLSVLRSVRARKAEARRVRDAARVHRRTERRLLHLQRLEEARRQDSLALAVEDLSTIEAAFPESGRPDARSGSVAELTAASALGGNSGFEGPEGAGIRPYAEVVGEEVARQEAAFARAAAAAAWSLEKRKRRAVAERKRLGQRKEVRVARAEYHAALAASSWRERKSVPLMTADGGLLFDFKEEAERQRKVREEEEARRRAAMEERLRSFPLPSLAATSETSDVDAAASSGTEQTRPDVTDVASAMAARTVLRPQAAPKPPQQPSSPSRVPFQANLPPGVGRGAKRDSPLAPNSFTNPPPTAPLPTPSPQRAAVPAPTAQIPPSPPAAPAPSPSPASVHPPSPPTPAPAPPPVPQQPPTPAPRPSKGFAASAQDALVEPLVERIVAHLTAQAALGANAPQPPVPPPAFTSGPQPDRPTPTDPPAPQQRQPPPVARRAAPSAPAPPPPTQHRSGAPPAPTPSTPAKQSKKSESMAEWEAVEASSWGLSSSGRSGFINGEASPDKGEQGANPVSAFFSRLFGRSDKKETPEDTRASLPKPAPPAPSPAPSASPARSPTYESDAMDEDEDEHPSSPQQRPPPSQQPQFDGAGHPLLSLINISKGVMDVVEEEAKKSNSRTLSAALQQIRSVVDTLPADAPPTPSPASMQDPWRERSAMPPPPPPTVPSPRPPTAPTQPLSPTSTAAGPFGAPPRTPARTQVAPPPPAPQKGGPAAPPPPPPSAQDASLERVAEAERRMKELQESVLARENEMRELREQLQRALAAAQANGQQAKVARAAVAAARDLASALQVEIESLESEVEELRRGKEGRGSG